MLSPVRTRIRAVVDSTAFQRFIITVIIVNAVGLGVEGSRKVTSGDLGGVFGTVDRLVVTIFLVELTLRVIAYGRPFFRDPWNWFDLIVVGVALVPGAETYAVLRLLRLLRVLRLISVVPSMKRVVGALFNAIPGLASIFALLALILYTGAVLGERLFGTVAPEFFGGLGRSLFTMFQVMTNENWPDVASAVMDDRPLSWIFFVVYIMVSAFIVLNLLIGVVVNAMQREVTDERWEQDRAVELAQHEEVVEELRALRREVETLRASVGAEPDTRTGPQPGE